MVPEFQIATVAFFAGRAEVRIPTAIGQSFDAVAFRNGSASNGRVCGRLSISMSSGMVGLEYVCFPVFRRSRQSSMVTDILARCGPVRRGVRLEARQSCLEGYSRTGEPNGSQYEKLSRTSL